MPGGCVVRQMLGEQVNDTMDGSVPDGFSMDDIELDTLRTYRQNFANRQPTHLLNDVDHGEFLRQLGGWNRDRQTAQEGPTLAGLLMFGKLRSILDAVPRYIVDYPRASPGRDRTALGGSSDHRFFMVG